MNNTLLVIQSYNSQDGEKLVKKVKGSFLFKVTGDNGKVVEWLIDLKTGKGSITKSPGKI